MKKPMTMPLFTIFMLLTLAFPCGCRNQIEVDGEHYDMLTEDETRQLLAFARETLIQNSPLAQKRRSPDSPQLLTIEEARKIRSSEPELKIEYRGDCSGEAVVIWDLEKHKFEVVVDGVLNETSPFKRNVMVRVMKKYGPVLDFRESQRTKNGTVPTRP